MASDPIPAWLEEDWYCVCNDLCQCNLAGRNSGYHHPGWLCSNFLRREECQGHPSLACQCSKVRVEYPRDNCNEHCMNDRIAAALSSVAVASLTRRRSHPVGGQRKLELVDPHQYAVGRCVTCMLFATVLVKKLWNSWSAVSSVGRDSLNLKGLGWRNARSGMGRQSI